MNDTAEKSAQTKPIRPFVRNNIKHLITVAVVREQDESIASRYRDLICKKLGISNRYTQMLNNTVQPSLEDACVIAQVLDVTVDELCVLASEDK